MVQSKASVARLLLSALRMLQRRSRLGRSFVQALSHPVRLALQRQQQQQQREEAGEAAAAQPPQDLPSGAGQAGEGEGQPGGQQGLQQLLEEWQEEEEEDGRAQELERAQRALIKRRHQRARQWWEGREAAAEQLASEALRLLPTLPLLQVSAAAAAAAVAAMAAASAPPQTLKIIHFEKKLVFYAFVNLPGPQPAALPRPCVRHALPHLPPLAHCSQGRPCAPLDAEHH